MKLPSFTTLSALLLASEIALAVAKRSKSQRHGQGSPHSSAPLDGDRHQHLRRPFSPWRLSAGKIASSADLLRYRPNPIPARSDHPLDRHHPSRPLLHCQRRHRGRPPAHHHRPLSLRPPSFLYRHAPDFPRVRAVHAEHLFSRSGFSPDHRRFPLEDARGRDRAQEAFGERYRRYATTTSSLLPWIY